MRVYHRLIHIRDQKERHDDIPEHIHSHPVFKLTTEFRQHVQKHSAPITKTSKLVVTNEGMKIFSNLATVLIAQGNTIMVYLVACILERLFGKDTIDNIEGLRGDLTIPDIIDGISTIAQEGPSVEEAGIQEDDDGEIVESIDESESQSQAEAMEELQTQPIAPTPVKPTSPQWLTNGFPGPSSAYLTTTSTTPSATGNAFAGLVSQSNASGTTNVFGSPIFSVSPSKQPASLSRVTDSSQSVFSSRIDTFAPQSTMSIPLAQPSSDTGTTTKSPQPIPFMFGSYLSLTVSPVEPNFRYKSILVRT
jgi:hypothetical protein